MEDLSNETIASDAEPGDGTGVEPEGVVSLADDARRLEADKAALEEKVAAAEARALRAERKVSLTGRVADVEAAMRLLDEGHLDEDGCVDVEALLASYPFLSPKPHTPSLDGPNPPGHGGAFTPEALRRMSEAEINANWEKIQADLGKGRR